MPGSVTGSGRPRRIRSWNSGTTEPRLPSTLPKRTLRKRVGPPAAPAARTSSSATCFVAPMTLAGTAALSVRDQHEALGAGRGGRTRIRFAVPRTLTATASSGFSSISGTCLWAAACRMRSTPWRPAEDVEALAIPHVADQRAQRRLRPRRGSSSAAISNRLFSPRPSSSSCAGRQRQQLPAQFAADGAARSGHQHAPPRHERARAVGAGR